jgi:hypothetical protein
MPRSESRTDGDRVLVVASNAGARKPPQWFLNLEANPRVTVVVLTKQKPRSA